MCFLTRLSAKIGNLIDSTCYAVEHHQMLKGGILLITVLAISAYGFLYVQNERAQLIQAQKLVDTTKQQADRLPETPQTKMSSRLAALAKKRLDWAGDAGDRLYKQLIEAAQVELAPAETKKNDPAGPTVAIQSQEWDREFNLFLKVQQQVFALPKSPDKDAADDMLSKAANRLVTLPYRDKQGYADKDVQQWFETAAWWAAAAQRKKAAAGGG